MMMEKMLLYFKKMWEVIIKICMLQLHEIENKKKVFHDFIILGFE